MKFDQRRFSHFHDMLCLENKTDQDNGSHIEAQWSIQEGILKLRMWELEPGFVSIGTWEMWTSMSVLSQRLQVVKHTQSLKPFVLCARNARSEFSAFHEWKLKQDRLEMRASEPNF